MFWTFIKSLASLMLLATILILATGCQEQSNIVGIGEDMDMEEARIQNILDLISNEMITEEEFLELDENTINAVLSRIDEMFPPTVQDAEERRERQNACRNVLLAVERYIRNQPRAPRLHRRHSHRRSG